MLNDLSNFIGFIIIIVIIIIIIIIVLVFTRQHITQCLSEHEGSSNSCGWHMNWWYNTHVFVSLFLYYMVNVLMTLYSITGHSLQAAFLFLTSREW